MLADTLAGGWGVHGANDTKHGLVQSCDWSALVTPQSSFMVVATIDPARESELRALLDGMNDAPGRVDLANALLPFGSFDWLHSARFVILDDLTLDDVTVYGMTPVTYPLALAFLGECDGDSEACLSDLARRAESGLRRLFACCGLGPGADVRAWLLAHNHAADTLYINRPGRSMGQIREDSDVCRAVEGFVQKEQSNLIGKDVREVHQLARRFVQDEVRAGRLTLTPEAPTPVRWQIRHLLNLVGFPLIVIALSPLATIASPVLIWMLRTREKTDPEVVPPVDPAHAERLAVIEDHDVTNQFNAVGTLKPGLFRRWLSVVILAFASFGSQHVFVNGRLGRVRTIHAARWAWIDNKRRLLFCSSYDGSLETYMDDFVNKVGWGLNLTFSNGIGYPATSWLVIGGARSEQKFKRYVRRHQLPSQVWYNGHFGITAYEIERRHRVRKGVETARLRLSEARAFCRLV
jgi:hypothetical protein